MNIITEKDMKLVLAKTVDGHIIGLNPNDQYITTDLYYTGLWEPHVRTIINMFVKNGMNVIDVGANIGAHTLLLSQIVGSKGSVLAFEPCLLNYNILNHNLKQNNCFNTKVLKKGCSDIEKKMFISKRWNDNKIEENYGAVSLCETGNNGDEVIDTVTIDSLELTSLDFIKIDAEHMEEKVLKGMKKTIKKFHPIIVLEIHKEDIRKIFKILQSFDYKTFFLGHFDYLAIYKYNGFNPETSFDFKTYELTV